MKAEERWAEQATYMYDFHIQELQETGPVWEKLLKKYWVNHFFRGIDVTTL
jgi:hypothetical protein